MVNYNMSTGTDGDEVREKFDMKKAKETIKKANTLLICTNNDDLKTKRVAECISNFSKANKRFNPQKMITIDLLDKKDKKDVDINGIYPDALYDMYKKLGMKPKKFMYILLWICPVFDFDLKKLSSTIDKDLLKTGIVSIITGESGKKLFIKAMENDFSHEESTKDMNDIVFKRSKGKRKLSKKRRLPKKRRLHKTKRKKK